jgi:hypothetical protein
LRLCFSVFMFAAEMNVPSPPGGEGYSEE